MSEIQTENIDAELIKVTLTEDGITATCYVTSHHLVPDKEAQLRAALRKRAYDAFIQQKAISALEAKAMGVPYDAA